MDGWMNEEEEDENDNRLSFFKSLFIWLQIIGILVKFSAFTESFHFLF